jgi:hypothetical protein
MTAPVQAPVGRREHDVIIVNRLQVAIVRDISAARLILHLDQVAVSSVVPSKKDLILYRLRSIDIRSCIYIVSSQNLGAAEPLYNTRFNVVNVT